MAKILEILIEKVKRAQKLAFYFIVFVCVFLYVCVCIFACVMHTR